ncbi:unnamed protein product [Cuscuta epithymum]|uniref:RING-type E3 ubiquitin transferase n=1 Tax=Cuscuta epithymum TaxID=186058 RepID=A0AAV0D9K4_9ASTE|nr:unnamed protein product [Cuscuta epithymum]
MDGTQNYHYLCCHCHWGFSSAHEAILCPQCFLELLYEIKSITFYLKDINDHQEPPLPFRWQSRNDEETEPFLMLRRPGVVIRLRWPRRGFQLQTNEWKGRSEELQSAIEHVTQCNQWYWCYECRKVGTLNQDNIVSSYPLEIIQCSECLRHRTDRFTNTTIDSHDHYNWCYQCHTPHVVTSSSSFENICPRCGAGDQFMAVIQIRRTTLIIDIDKQSSMRNIQTNSFWFIEQMSHPPVKAWTEQYQREYFSSPKAVAGLLELRHILYTMDLEELDSMQRYSPQYNPHSVESSRTMDAIHTVNISESHLGSERRCSVCLEDFEVGGKASELPCNHIYHRRCITPWLINEYTCPICRHDVHTAIRAIENCIGSCDDEQHETTDMNIDPDEGERCQEFEQNDEPERHEHEYECEQHDGREEYEESERGHDGQEIEPKLGWRGIDKHFKFRLLVVAGLKRVGALFILLLVAAFSPFRAIRLKMKNLY